MPEGEPKSALAPIRRPPYSNFAHMCKVAAKSVLFFWAVQSRSRWRLCRLRKRHTPCGYGPFSFRQDRKGPPPRPARGGERRSAQAHGVGAEVPLGCKGAGAVFALGPPPRPARWGEPEQRSERVLASMAGTRDAELVTARETELSGLKVNCPAGAREGGLGHCDDDNGGCIARLSS